MYLLYEWILVRLASYTCSWSFEQLFGALRTTVRLLSNLISHHGGLPLSSNASLRVSENNVKLVWTLPSESRLEVKSRTEFVENVAGFILVRDTPYLKLYLKVTNNLWDTQARGRGRARKSHLFSWKFYKTLYFNKLGSCVLIKRVTLLVILLVSTWGSRTQLLSYSVL